MAAALSITSYELRRMISDRLIDMGRRVMHGDTPINFVRTDILKNIESVRGLVEQLREGEEHTIVTVVPRPIPVTMSTNQENEAGVNEIFTERGV